jgi:hypothetical protein
LFEPGLAQGRAHQAQHGAQPLEGPAGVVHASGTIVTTRQRTTRNVDLLKGNAAHL